MKKLLAIIVLGFFLNGCSNKKETSIENCADENYVYDHSDSMTRIFYDINDKKIQAYGKTLDDSIKKQNYEMRQYRNWLNKNYKDGSMLKDITYPEEINTPAKKGIYKERIKIEKEKFLENIRWHQSNVAYISKQLKGLKNYSASKRFLKAPLKKKIIDELYYNQYVACEKEYSEAPGAFEMKWKDR
jgi:hypothetical protein